MLFNRYNELKRIRKFSCDKETRKKRKIIECFIRGTHHLAGAGFSRSVVMLLAVMRFLDKFVYKCYIL